MSGAWRVGEDGLTLWGDINMLPAGRFRWSCAEVFWIMSPTEVSNSYEPGEVPWGRVWTWGKHSWAGQRGTHTYDSPRPPPTTKHKPDSLVKPHTAAHSLTSGFPSHRSAPLIYIEMISGTFRKNMLPLRWLCCSSVFSPNKNQCFSTLGSEPLIGSSGLQISETKCNETIFSPETAEFLSCRIYVFTFSCLAVKKIIWIQPLLRTLLSNKQDKHFCISFTSFNNFHKLGWLQSSSWSMILRTEPYGLRFVPLEIQF